MLVTRQRADRLAATLAEILIVFSPVSSYTGIRIGWTTHLPIHPDDYDQWDAVLNDTAHVTPTRQSDRTA